MTVEKILSSTQEEVKSIKDDFSDLRFLDGKIQDLLEKCIFLSFSKKAEGRKDEAEIFLRCAVALEAAISYADYKAQMAFIESKEGAVEEAAKEALHSMQKAAEKSAETLGSFRIGEE